MWHSVSYIASQYSHISKLRGDCPEFSEKGFIDFAKANKEKYHMLDGDCDLLVSTWYSSELIAEYQKAIVEDWSRENVTSPRNPC